MKKMKAVLFTLSLALMASCSSDDTTIEPVMDNGPVNPVSNPEPEEPVVDNASETIFENVQIQGGTEREGLPPTPNQGISLVLATEDDAAFPEVGFAIPFESDGDVTGAYIQFKAEGKEFADSYYDVSLEDNMATAKTAKKPGVFAKRPSEDAFQIDLTESLDTGTFCYAICVYDANGNISAPQEFCVSITSWGGNDALLGDWNLLRSVDFANGIADTVTVGVERCDAPIGNDPNNTCYLFEYETLLFNEDGTFIVEIRESHRNPAIETTYTNYDIERLTGNWSFDADSGRLYLVIFKYEYEENGLLLETEEYANGDEEIVAAQRIELGTDTLNVVFVEADLAGDGNIDESYTAYYERL